ncbi:MAG: alkaline phosphatase family protein [Actinomycetota bacterium]|nr:alkaline phosphatase family protein [Actinomycetota bacterium]
MPSVVIGLDGSAWQLLDPLMADGTMPRLRALRERGASGILTSTVPPVTPPAWTSAITGVNPGRHGIYGFHRGNAQHEKPEMMHSGQVKATTLWEMARAQGASIGLFNVPLTYPPPEIDEGWSVAGFMTPGINQALSGFTHPPELGDEISRWIPDYVIEIKANQEQDWRDDELAKRALAAVKQRRDLLAKLLETRPVDLVFSVLETPDRLQHLYYRYMDPSDRLYESEAGRRIRPTINQCFDAMDEVIGLLDDYAGETGGAIVCSDHGFTAWEASVHTNRLLEEWGYLKLKGAGKVMRSGIGEKAVHAARRFLPVKIRRAARQRTGGTAIDWSQTKAFATVYYQQGVVINLEGRERFGIVTEAEAEALKEEIATRFKELKGPDGEIVTDRMWRAEDVFEGEALEGAPDLVFEIKDSRWQLDDELHHRQAISDHRELPRGGHHPDGIGIVAGPGVRKGARVDGSIMDVTPTLLYLAGLKVPDDLDGSVLTDAFQPEHLKENPVQTMGHVEASERDESSPYSPEEEKAIEEELRGLGYI